MLVPRACAIPGEALPFTNPVTAVDVVPIVLASPGEHSPVRKNLLIREDVVPAFVAIPEYPIVSPLKYNAKGKPRSCESDTRSLCINGVCYAVYVLQH